MRILHCISSMNPAGGGPVEALKQLSVAYEASGCTVHVATLDEPSAPWIKDAGLPVFALGPRYLGKWGYAPAYRGWIKSNASRYDLIVIDGIWQYHSFGAWSALKGTGVPYVVFTHGMLDPWFKRRYPLKHFRKWMFWPWADYRVLRDAKAVLFTCEEERRLARRSFWLYKARGVVVPFGTSMPPGEHDLQKALFLERFPGLKKKRVLLFLGRIHEKKGVEMLIRAFAAHAESMRENSVALVIAGPDDGDYAVRMKALARELGVADQILWTGMLRDKLKWGAFRVSDAFILPSFQENFGIAVAEAAACGVPVLISDQVNIWREIEEADAGFVAPATIAGTERLLSNWLKAPSDEMGRKRVNAHKCFLENFLIDRLPSRLIALLHQSDARCKAL